MASTAVIEEDDESYVPIGQRPEWAGFAPRPLPALDPQVVSIARDQQFGDLMDYFWAAVEAGVSGFKADTACPGCCKWITCCWIWRFGI